MNAQAIPFPGRRVSVARGKIILAALEKVYPEAVTALDYTTPFELLISVILSAQTTDVMVNKVTPALFAHYPTAVEFAQAEIGDVDRLIHRLGLHRNKARNCVATAQMLVEHYSGEVPKTREELETLAGVGRKTASVVLSVAYGEAAFAVDTHVFRVAQRLGLARGSQPRDIEEQVTRLLPTHQWGRAHHWLILHGRAFCKAQRPDCEACPVAELCPSRVIVARARAEKGRRLTAAPAKLQSKGT